MIFVGIVLILVGVIMSVALAPRADAQDYAAVPAEADYPAPLLGLTDIHGKSRVLADYRGSVVLVNLWATWCPPCKAEMPTLQAFYEENVANGFVIVGINDGESEPVVVAFVHAYNLTFPIWLDPGFDAERVFGAISLPSSYVIDRAGVTRLMWVGAIDTRNLERFVTPLLKE